MPTSPSPGLEPTDEARSVPPRYVWLRRFVVLGVVLLAVFIALRVWWGHVRLQAAIAACRAAGQPVLIEDFATEPVPDDENAALLLTQAAAALSLPKGQIGLRDWLENPRLAGEYPAELEALLKANEQTLALYREGCAKPRADWGFVLRSPVINVVVPGTFVQRRLAYLAGITAHERHLAGDDAAAVTLLRDIQAHAHHVGDTGPFLISHLISIAVQRVATRVIESIAPTLLIEGTPGGCPAGAVPADRRDVEALVATLLDEEPWRSRWRRAFYGERLAQLDAVQCLGEGRMLWPVMMGAPPSGVVSVTGRALALLFAPAWEMDGVRMVEHCTAFAEIGQAPNWPAAQALQPPPLYDLKAPALKMSSRMLSAVLAPYFEGAAKPQFEMMAERRMAATALALRLYELDHGRRPASLDALVPDYLPAVPRDPFAADDRPLGYLPDAIPPLLYSVGMDGVDDGGRFEQRPNNEIIDTAADMPFFLDGDRPLPRLRAVFAAGASQPTSMQAVPDNEVADEPDAEANETDEGQPEH